MREISLCERDIVCGRERYSECEIYSVCERDIVHMCERDIVSVGDK